MHLSGSTACMAPCIDSAAMPKAMYCTFCHLCEDLDRHWRYAAWFCHRLYALGRLSVDQHRSMCTGKKTPTDVCSVLVGAVALGGWHIACRCSAVDSHSMTCGSLWLADSRQTVKVFACGFTPSISCFHPVHGRHPRRLHRADCC